MVAGPDLLSRRDSQPHTEVEPQLQPAGLHHRRLHDETHDRFERRDLRLPDTDQLVPRFDNEANLSTSRRAAPECHERDRLPGSDLEDVTPGEFFGRDGHPQTFARTATLRALLLLPDLDGLRTPDIAPVCDDVSGNFGPLASIGTYTGDPGGASGGYAHAIWGGSTLVIRHIGTGLAASRHRTVVHYRRVVHHL